MGNPNSTALVPIKSAWSSKINWTQAVALTATGTTLVFGPSASLTPEQQLAIVTVIHIIGAVVTWVCRTWFNRSVSPGSV